LILSFTPEPMNRTFWGREIEGAMVPLHKRTLLPAIFLVLICIYTASGQTVDRNVKVDANADRDFDFSIRATSILSGIMEGLSEGDYDKFTRDFSSKMRQSQNREGFLQLQRSIQKSLGKLRSIDFMGSYNQQGAVVTLFKARFSKDKDDVLVKLVLDGQSKSKVTGLWFDSPALE